MATVLANRLSDKYPDAQIYRNLRGVGAADPSCPSEPASGPADPIDVMRSIILDFLPDAKVPDAPEELRRTYLEVLRGANRALLFFDNVADAEQVLPLLPPVNCLLLMTSRQYLSLPDVAVCELRCLPRKQSCAWLVDMAPRLSGHEEEAAALCGHLPLALRILAATVNERRSCDVLKLLAKFRQFAAALIVGVPGTGKSLTAKATASVLGRPLLRLDAGRLFGSLVGQSEANMRAVIQVAEAVAPCVLWIDELEKGFAGSRSSGSSDGGTGSRVFGSFISWMQERTAPVFVVATANDVSQLPPELLRKGRWDELFFTDLPCAGEREQIWRIQIGRCGRKPEAFDVEGLALASEGHTGAEIGQAVTDALYRAFAESREPRTGDMLAAVSESVPLSKLMGEQIQGLRKWAAGRCRMAAKPDAVAEATGRRIAA